MNKYNFGVFEINPVFNNDRYALEASVDLPTLQETVRKFNEELTAKSEELILQHISAEALQLLRKKVEDELVRRARAGAK